MSDNSDSDSDEDSPQNAETESEAPFEGQLITLGDDQKPNNADVETLEDSSGESED